MVRIRKSLTQRVRDYSESSTDAPFALTREWGDYDGDYLLIEPPNTTQYVGIENQKRITTRRC